MLAILFDDKESKKSKGGTEKPTHHNQHFDVVLINRECFNCSDCNFLCQRTALPWLEHDDNVHTVLPVLQVRVDVALSGHGHVLSLVLHAGGHVEERARFVLDAHNHLFLCFGSQAKVHALQGPKIKAKEDWRPRAKFDLARLSKEQVDVLESDVECDVLRGEAAHRNGKVAREIAGLLADGAFSLGTSTLILIARGREKQGVGVASVGHQIGDGRGAIRLQAAFDERCCEAWRVRLIKSKAKSHIIIGTDSLGAMKRPLGRKVVNNVDGGRTCPGHRKQSQNKALEHRGRQNVERFTRQTNQSC
eukprot:m.36738 g.36738  ORF g.36738 m.36738 type:complete len:305 (+) comp9713_c0_seq1:1709-2623(+)